MSRFGPARSRQPSRPRGVLGSQQYLNPWLYNRLCRVFGHVVVAHQGERLIARSVDDMIRRRKRLIFQQHGESYRVNCFACHDTRRRLYVSYMYGQRDDDGRSLSFLACCFNENCLDNPDHRFRLRDMVEEVDGSLERARVFAGVTLPAAPETFDMPTNCVRLDELPVGHPARVYVSGRHLDPDRLARSWGVSYCKFNRNQLVSERLVVPIAFGGKLAGWQARHVGELDWKGRDKKTPKYYTCPGMRRDLVVCNWDMAKAYRTVVIVEGWFDVFSFGPMAVNTLGVGMSPQQMKKIAATFRAEGRSVVLLYDDDVFKNEKLRKRVVELRANLKRMLPGRFFQARLPEGRDPGSLDRSLLRQLVAGQAEEAGVEVGWDKVA